MLELVIVHMVRSVRNAKITQTCIMDGYMYHVRVPEQIQGCSGIGTTRAWLGMVHSKTQVENAKY